jgi:hypothetical protein
MGVFRERGAFFFLFLEKYVCGSGFEKRVFRCFGGFRGGVLREQQERVRYGFEKGVFLHGSISFC